MPNRLSIADLSVHTLQGINLQVDAGQCIGLTGPSGSGKTLLLRALADMDPHQGRVSMNGMAADQIPPPHWRRQVGMLPAESAWWHDTVGPHFETDAQHWLERLGFDSDVMTWDIRRLSSGERQRLSLARLLVLEPHVLLLDEPTANLDAENVDRVEDVLNDYKALHQPAIIWVSHDLIQLQRNCDGLYRIEGAQLTLHSDGPI